MKFDKFTTKDFVLLGLMTALYAIIYIVFAALTDVFLPLFVHVAMQGVIALFFSGTIMVFLLVKIPKLGVFSLYFLIQIILFAITGMSYLPWFISIGVGAVLADLISASSNYNNKHKNAIAYGLTQMGVMAGGVIPVWFFTQNYIDYWVSKGQSVEKMQASADVLLGYSGASLLAITFFGGVFGVYLGYKLLDKHFKKTASEN